jgi:hypothetical protein
LGQFLRYTFGIPDITYLCFQVDLRGNYEEKSFLETSSNIHGKES